MRNTIFIVLGFILMGSTVCLKVNAADVSKGVQAPVLQEEKPVLQDIAPNVEVPKSDYTLPYPGILPDHPLYMLKKIRDSILERLITDPIRKVEFYILQSDKEVNAGTFLAAKGKPQLVSQSINRAIVFKERAVGQITTLASQGKEVPLFIRERLHKSLQKQLDVQADLSANMKGSDISIFVSAEQKITQLKTEISTVQ